jgi:SAM-dependent methyltransferase
MSEQQAKFAERGAPSFVWRAGQERRLNMICRWANTNQSMILIDGCGLGMYAVKLLENSPHVYAFDIEIERAIATRDRVANTHVSAAEMVPYPPNTFDLILSHEVLEHVEDDGMALAEMARTLKPGGRIVLFCPNRWYPFETHGHYWQGTYHFGNTPLINYLPTELRNKLAPHVKAYRWHDLRALIDDLPVRVVYRTRIFGGYDNIIARTPRLGRLLRDLLYVLEKTPLRFFALSHLVILEKTN